MYMTIFTDKFLYFDRVITDVGANIKDNHLRSNRFSPPSVLWLEKNCRGDMALDIV